MYQDQWGNTPLHGENHVSSAFMFLSFSLFSCIARYYFSAASYVNPPLHVIQAIFRAARVIWKYSINQPNIPIWSIPATDNSTPFLVACSTGAATDVLQCYLDEVEYYIDQNWTDCSARLLVLKPDDQGTNPLMGWASFHRGWMERTPAARSRGPKQLHNYLELATRMVWFATMQTYPDQPSSDQLIIQRCAFVASQCPVFLMQWLINPHGDGAETRVSESECAISIRDERNKLPLHYAIESPASLVFGGECNSNNVRTTQNHNLEMNRNQMIETLLNWFPKGAGEHFPNGRTSLCEAIARGGHWHASTEVKLKGYTSNGVIKLLYEHAPDKLLERDATTGLYPFMLAAISSTDNKDTGAIDTIYNLLRRDPQPIVDCVWHHL